MSYICLKAAHVIDTFKILLKIKFNIVYGADNLLTGFNKTEFN